MEQTTRTLWGRINNFYIPLIFDTVNNAKYTSDRMYTIANAYHYEMKGFIQGYLYMAPYNDETSENFDLASDLCREIWDEVWEIYTNR